MLKVKIKPAYFGRSTARAICKRHTRAMIAKVTIRKKSVQVPERYKSAKATLQCSNQSLVILNIKDISGQAQGLEKGFNGI